MVFNLSFEKKGLKLITAKTEKYVRSILLRDNILGYMYIPTRGNTGFNLR